MFVDRQVDVSFYREEAAEGPRGTFQQVDVPPEELQGESGLYHGNQQ